MCRTEIHGAPYNPRRIDTYARKKLKENIRKNGLMGAAIVVNSTTMNLVSGHQRLSILDELEGRGDYFLDVSIVTMTEAEEKAQNVFMNNASAQGTYDIDQLAQLLAEDGVDMEATGFDRMDLEVMFDESTLEIFNLDAAPESVRGAVADVEAIAAMKTKKKQTADAVEAENDPDFYLVVVFDSREEAEAFSKAAGRDPDERYLSGRWLAHKLGIDLKG